MISNQAPTDLQKYLHLHRFLLSEVLIAIRTRCVLVVGPSRIDFSASRLVSRRMLGTIPLAFRREDVKAGSSQLLFCAKLNSTTFNTIYRPKDQPSFQRLQYLPKWVERSIRTSMRRSSSFAPKVIQLITRTYDVRRHLRLCGDVSGQRR